MSQAIDHHEQYRVPRFLCSPSITANVFPFYGNGQYADIDRPMLRNFLMRPKIREDSGSSPRCRVNIEGTGNPLDSPQSTSRSSGGRVSVAQCRAHIADARALDLDLEHAPQHRHYETELPK